VDVVLVLRATEGDPAPDSDAQCEGLSVAVCDTFAELAREHPWGTVAPARVCSRGLEANGLALAAAQRRTHT
jgi:hypothetical protein